jgi:ABC-type thiamine transport system substrate-binding protein
MAAAETPVLTVLTYDSFHSEWGPGPAVEQAFEATCACDLRFVRRGTARRCWRACSLKARGPRPMWCWGWTPT